MEEKLKIGLKCAHCGNKNFQKPICEKCNSGELSFDLDENNPIDNLKKQLLYGEITKREFDQKYEELNKKDNIQD